MSHHVNQHLSQGYHSQTKESQDCCQQVQWVGEEQDLQLGGHHCQRSHQRHRGCGLHTGQTPGGRGAALPKDQGAGGPEQEAGGRDGPPSPEEPQGQVHALLLQELHHHQDRRGAGEGGHHPCDPHPEPDPDEAGGRGPQRRCLLLQSHLHRPAALPPQQLPPLLLLPQCGGRHQVWEKPGGRPVFQLCTDEKESCAALRGQDAKEEQQDPQVLHRRRWADHHQDHRRLQEDQDLLGVEQEGLLNEDGHHRGAEGQVGVVANLKYSTFTFLTISLYRIFMPIHKLAAALFGGSLGLGVVSYNECK